MKKVASKLTGWFYNTFHNLMRRTEGLSTVEYIIILVLIAVAGITLWQKFGVAVMEKITSSTTAVNDLGK